uniref:Troponin I, slow skeletal muscle n=1 Tax=Fundulus heteroclitus TaxID=8078 RepID=A0A3Q2PYS5_FUNHE
MLKVSDCSRTLNILFAQLVLYNHINKCLLPQPKSKISASRKLSLKMLLLQKACEDLEKERQDREEEKGRYLKEKLPPLQLSGLSLDDLQKLCKELHEKIDIVDEERYDSMSGMEGRKKMFDTAGGAQ